GILRPWISPPVVAPVRRHAAHSPVPPKRRPDGFVPARSVRAPRAAGPDARYRDQPMSFGRLASAETVGLPPAATFQPRGLADGRCLVGLQHEARHALAAAHMLLENLVDVVAGFDAVPDPVRIDHHRRAELAAIETAG